jgi:hypothetical protein
MGLWCERVGGGDDEAFRPISGAVAVKMMGARMDSACSFRIGVRRYDTQL